MERALIEGGTSTVKKTSHTYSAAGIYSANLTVTDANGAKAGATTLSFIVHGLLSASSSATPRVGDAPLAVTFTGTPSGGSTPYAFAWAFGDGASSTAQSPSHTYAAAGTYSASLTVTDADGGNATPSPLTITANPPPGASAAATPITGDAPIAVGFTTSVTGGNYP